MAELVLIQDADPARALDAAWRRGEKRFLGVRGFSLSVPGAEAPTGELDELVFKKQGVRVIEGTTDFYMDEKHKRLIDGAVGYAERYNTLLLRKLGVRLATKPSG
ncbi:MAG: hypothetical protein M3478_13570 [Planctomycetota bacterium]|nr:hypothetical protein [Planctomycetota bacterium]